MFVVILSWTLILNLSNRHGKVATPSSWVEAIGVFQLHHFLPLFPSQTVVGNRAHVLCCGGQHLMILAWAGVGGVGHSLEILQKTLSAVLKPFPTTPTNSSDFCRGLISAWDGEQ